MERKVVTCRYCGEDIFFMKDRKGRTVPCEPGLVPYKAGGYEQLMTEDGDHVRGYLHFPAGELPSGMAYRVHFASCTRGKAGRQQDHG